MGFSFLTMKNHIAVQISLTTDQYLLPFTLRELSRIQIEAARFLDACGKLVRKLLDIKLLHENDFNFVAICHQTRECQNADTA